MRYLIPILLFFSTQANGQWELIWDENQNPASYNLRGLDVYDEDKIGIIASNSDTTFYLSSENGGMTWDTVMFNNPNHYLKSVDFISPDTGYIAAYTNYQLNYNALIIYETVDGGNTWNEIYFSDSTIYPNLVVNLPIKCFDENLMAVTTNISGYVTNSGTDVWYDPIEPFQGDFSVLRNGKFASFEGVYAYVSDDSLNTIHKKQIFDYAASNNGDIYTEGNVSTLYAGGVGMNGNELGYGVNNYGTISISELNSTEWTEIHFPEFGYVTDVAYTENAIYATNWTGDFHNKFMKSIDNGQTWYSQSSPNELSFGYLRELECVNDSVCYAFIGDQIFKTSNGGGLLQEEIISIPFPATDIVEVGTENVKVSPNPTSGLTTLSLSFQEPTNIFIYNLQGKLMKELQTNTQEVQIELPDEQGVYLIQVVGETFSSVVKVVRE